MDDRRSALAAGALAGAAGLAAFLLAHAAWILPIWFIAAPGLAFAVPGGAAVGRAYAEVRDRLPRGAWRPPALAAGLLATLVPSQILASLRPELTLGMIAQAPAPIFALAFVEVAATAGIVGGLLALALSRTRRAALLGALAGAAFGVGLGHNVPLIGWRDATVTLWAVMGVATLAAAVVLVAVDAGLRARSE